MPPDFKRHNLLADKPRKKRGETRGDAAPEEQGQQAMRVVVALTLAVPFVLMWVYIATREVRRRGTAGRKRLEDP
jgi:hypothetical protein